MNQKKELLRSLWVCYMDPDAWLLFLGKSHGLESSAKSLG